MRTTKNTINDAMVDMLALDRPTVEDPRQSERSGPRKMSTPVIVARVLGAGYHGRVGPSLEDLCRPEMLQRQEVLRLRGRLR